MRTSTSFSRFHLILFLAGIMIVTDEFIIISHFLLGLFVRQLDKRSSTSSFLCCFSLLFSLSFEEQTLLASIIASVWPYSVVPSAVHSPFSALPRSGFVVSNSFHAVCIVCYARHSLICASSLKILRFNIKDMGSEKSRETISPSIILSSFVSWPFFFPPSFYRNHYTVYSGSVPRMSCGRWLPLVQQRWLVVMWSSCFFVRRTNGLWCIVKVVSTNVGLLRVCFTNYCRIFL